jgi:hypothetical protein
MPDDADRISFREQVCPRCGELLAPYAGVDDDELPFVPTAWASEGDVHWDCATLAEQRREDFKCERCGTQFYDDGRDSDAGWITEPHRLLCPDCITPKEDREDTQKFLDVVTRGQLIAELDGRDYPADLAALAEHEAERLRRSRR